MSGQLRKWDGLAGKLIDNPEVVAFFGRMHGQLQGGLTSLDGRVYLRWI
jgi:hypothetical protein